MNINVSYTYKYLSRTETKLNKIGLSLTLIIAVDSVLFHEILFDYERKC